MATTLSNQDDPNDAAQDAPAEYQQDAAAEKSNDEGDGQDILTDYIPQSLVATHPLVYADMEFGASGIYCQPGTDCDGPGVVDVNTRGRKSKRMRTLKAVVTSAGGIDIKDVVVSDTVTIRLAGRQGSKIRGTALFRIKTNAPSCNIVIQAADDATVATDTIVVDNDPDS